MNSFLSYNKNDVLECNNKKSCGLWLIAVALVILLATFVGGKQLINMPIFSFGYVICFFTINLNPRVLNKLSEGTSTKFQDKIANYSVILLFVLIFLLGGPFFGSENWRLIWSGALLATGLHFFPYYFVHGRSMIWLGMLCSLNILLAYFSPVIPFVYFALGDAFLKLGFGIYLLFFSTPTRLSFGK